jgi:hypothetical protein
MEIRGPHSNQPLQPQGPQGPGEAAPTGKTGDKSFSEVMGAGAAQTGGAAAPVPTAAAYQPNFSRLQSLILDAAGRNLSKQQVLEAVVGQELAAQFGKHATPQLANAVTERFQTDPQLSQLFNRLYSAATKR